MPKPYTDHRLQVLLLEASRMLGLPKEERLKEYGTQGPRLIMQALRSEMDAWEAQPND